MDNTKYYYQFNSKARGPISADKIKALLDSGLITMETMDAVKPGRYHLLP